VESRTRRVKIPSRTCRRRTFDSHTLGRSRAILDNIVVIDIMVKDYPAFSCKIVGVVEIVRISGKKPGKRCGHEIFDTSQQRIGAN
jgi:hypothetical protein